VSLLEKDEAVRLKIPHELEECQKLGMATYNFPVRDCTIPDDVEAYKALAKEVVEEQLRKGKNVLVHCMGGLGRAPTFVATCLIYAGAHVE
jgi:ADP-ribosyl-[dinitrogen reductase] hydrolase